MATWYVYQNNVQTGPVSEDQLSGMGLTPATLWYGAKVWSNGSRPGRCPNCHSCLKLLQVKDHPSQPRPSLARSRGLCRNQTVSVRTRRSAISGRARRSAISECPRRILSTRRCLHTRLRQGDKTTAGIPGHTPWFLRCAVFLSRQNRSRDTDYRALIRHLWYLESADIRTGHCHAHNVSGTV